MRFLVIVILFGLACGASISPVEIAEARQRCTTQCANPNHLEAAACMRQCWATFFAERKAGRHANVQPSPKARSPVVKAHTPVAVKAPFAPHRSGAPAKKVAHKSRSVSRGKHSKVVRHARSSGHKLVGMGAVLIAMVFLLM